VKIECKFAISELGLDDVGQREVIAFVSTETPDLDRDVILARGWDLSYFRKHPSVMLMHAYGELPMGTCRWIKVKDHKLVAKTWYIDKPKDHPHEVEWLPDTVLHYRQRGVMKGYSVGFAILSERMPTEKEIKSSGGDWDGCRVIDKALLLEYSDVPLPCNPEATQLLVGKGWLPAPEETDNDGTDTKAVDGQDAPCERAVPADPADSAAVDDGPAPGVDSCDPDAADDGVVPDAGPVGECGSDVPSDGVEDEAVEDPPAEPEPEKAAPVATPAPSPADIAHRVVLQQIAAGKFVKIDEDAIRARVLRERIDDELAYHRGNLGK